MENVKFKKRTKKAMSLFEVMISICVSSMLFVSLGSSFYMFRVLNKNTINNSKKELNMMAIKDYIETNTDRILLYKIGGTCMYVDIDELAPKYDLFINDKMYYLVGHDDVAEYLSNHRSITANDNIGSFENIGLNDENGNPIVNINGDYIIRFDIMEYTSENSHFYIVSYDEEGNEKVSPVYRFTDLNREYSNEIGESLYYSEMDIADNNKSSAKIFEELLDGIFYYRENSTVIEDKNGKRETIKTKALIENVDGTEKILFDNLPYQSLNITHSVKINSFSMIDENGTLVPTYGIDIRSAYLDYDDAGNEVYIEDNDHGIAYVTDSNYDQGIVACEADQILFTGREIKDENNPLNLSDGLIEDTEDISDSAIYSFKFIGWKVEDIQGITSLTEKNTIVTIPEDGTRRKVVAVYEKTPTLFDGDITNNTIDYSLRYTYGTKYTYVVNCNIKYSEKNDSGSIDDREINFVTGVYYKYDPQVFTGSKEN